MTSKSFHSLVAGAASMAALLLPSAPAWAQGQTVFADTVFENGTIYTDVQAGTSVEAVAVRDGMILEVGSVDEMRGLAGAETQIVDLGRRTMLPGFYDNHIHLNVSWDPRVQDWEAIDSKEDLMEVIAARAAELPAGEWVMGDLANETMPQENLPTRWELDAVTPNHPVTMRRGHITLANTLAMDLAGVSDASVAPPGGDIDRDEQGRAIGWFREGSGRRMIMDAVPAPPPAPDEEAEGQLRSRLSGLLPLGITSINSAGVRPDQMRWLQSTYERWGETLPRTTVQLRLSPGYDSFDDLDEGAAVSIDELEALSFVTGFGSDRLTLGSVKMSIDGGFSAAAFWTLEPHPGHDDEYGLIRIPREAFYPVAKRAHELGWQLGTHAIGDGAEEMVVDVYRQILEEDPRPDARHFIHHFSVMPPAETLQTMADYGILVASQPNFTYSLGPYNAAPALSPERLATNNPQRTVLDYGIGLSYGSDGMPTDPRVGIYAAVTRKGEDGLVYGIEEAVSMTEAVYLYTQAPAYLNFFEDERGSITAGKVADFVVLDQDIFTIDPEDVMDLPIAMTIVGGNILYVAGQGE